MSCAGCMYDSLLAEHHKLPTDDMRNPAMTEFFNLHVAMFYNDPRELSKEWEIITNHM